MRVFKGNKAKTSPERFTELLFARRKKVAKKNLRSVANGFIKRMNGISDIKNGRLKSHIVFFRKNNEFELDISLERENRKLADSRVTIRRFGGKLELEIGYFQGIWGAGKESYTRFMAENQGIPWNVSLVGSIVKAAYKSDFDRVLLRDITTTYDYESPQNLVLSRRNADDVRNAMKQLYTRTRKACNFTKEEWRGKSEPGYSKTRYWIREFP